MSYEAAFQRYIFLRDRAAPPIFAVIIGIILILLFDRREPLDVSGLTVTPNPVAAGAQAYAIYEADSDRNCDGLVHRTIIDSGQHVFTLATEPTVYPALLAPTKRQFVKSFTIPVGVSKGVATYRSDVERWCNPVQWLLWRFHDHYETTFTVR